MIFTEKCPKPERGVHFKNGNFIRKECLEAEGSVNERLENCCKAGYYHNKPSILTCHFNMTDGALLWRGSMSCIEYIKVFKEIKVKIPLLKDGYNCSMKGKYLQNTSAIQIHAKVTEFLSITCIRGDDVRSFTYLMCAYSQSQVVIVGLCLIIHAVLFLSSALFHQQTVKERESQLSGELMKLIEAIHESQISNICISMS